MNTPTTLCIFILFIKLPFNGFWWLYIFNTWQKLLVIAQFISWKYTTQMLPYLRHKGYYILWCGCLWCFQVMSDRYERVGRTWTPPQFTPVWHILYSVPVKCVTYAVQKQDAFAVCSSYWCTVVYATTNTTCIHYFEFKSKLLLNMLFQHCDLLSQYSIIFHRHSLNSINIG